MKHYAGIHLLMETTHVCVVDETGRKLRSAKVESTLDASAEALGDLAPSDR